MGLQEIADALMGDWQRDALCRELGVPLDLFFVENVGAQPMVEKILRMCHACPVREECLRYGMAVDSAHPGHSYGIFGGATARMRKAARRGVPLFEKKRSRPALIGTQCVECLRPMTPKGIGDLPGMIPAGASHKCKECSQKPGNCPGCGCDVRLDDGEEMLAPSEHVKTDLGLCVTCFIRWEQLVEERMTA